MTIRFLAGNSLYDCRLQITDQKGTREFLLPTAARDAEVAEDIEIFGNSFELAVTPIKADYNAMLGVPAQNTWKEKLGKKFLDAAFENVLAVGCKYRVADMQDGGAVTLCFQSYMCGPYNFLLAAEFIPTAYMFFEVLADGERLEPLAAWPTNRKAVVKSAKMIALCAFGLGLIVTYPVQVGRVKYLTGARHVYRRLHRFHCMSPAERQKLLEKMREV